MHQRGLRIHQTVAPTRSDSDPGAEPMTNPASGTSRPETIDGLRITADLAMAMLAGVQLDLFNPLRDGL